MFSKNAIIKRGRVPAYVSKRFSTYIPDRRQNIRPTVNDRTQKMAAMQIGFKISIRPCIAGVRGRWLFNLGSIQQLVSYSPTVNSFLICKPKSLSGVIIPSNVPNIDPRPRFISIAKNRTLQNGPPGIFVMASVNAMKAKPGPDTA